MSKLSIDKVGRFRQFVGMIDDTPPLERQDVILDSAFRAFASYGFRRTSMEDVARGAGLSRTALYLHFRNKEDIVRSLTLRHFDQAVAAMAEVLARPGQSDEARLLAAFKAKDGRLMEILLTSPHGSEILDAGHAATADLARQGEDRIVGMLAGWLCARGVPAGLGSPEELARDMVTALMGLKSSARSLETYLAGQARLARIFARALAAPVPA